MIDPAPARAPRAALGWAAALASGVLLAAAFPPANAGWLAWVALAPLLAALRGVSPRAAAARGYVCGFAFMAGVGHFASAFGGDVLWMRLLPWLLFSALEAVFFIPVGVALAAILRRGRPWGVALGVPAVWVLGEWLRGAGPLGFPFGALGYALHDSLAAQMARLGGVYLVSALAAGTGTALYLLLCGGRAGRRAAWYVLGVAVLAHADGMLSTARFYRDESDGWRFRRRVLVAQGASNAPWDTPEAAAQFRALRARTVAAARSGGRPPDLVVWSESSVPGMLDRDGGLRRGIVDTARATGAPLLTGAIQRAPSGAPSNVALLFQPNGALGGEYQKRRLVPFGEWVPFRNVLPLLDAFGVVEEDELPGTEWRVLATGPFRLGVPICFESAAPEISRAFVRRGANLLVIITNDAWFGRTGMAEHHAQVAQLRAIETGRWVVRVGHTGISGFIRPDGRWQGQLPLNAPDALQNSVTLREGRTLYVRWGHWFLGVCGVVVLFALFSRALPPATTAPQA